MSLSAAPAPPDPHAATRVVAPRGPAATPAQAPDRARWAWFGVAAGVLGAAAHLLTDPQGSLTPDERQLGARVLEHVDRGGYHLGAVLGFVTVGLVLVVAAGWRRWADDHAPRSLAARVVSSACTAAAGAMTIGYGFKGALAVYLPGGVDDGDYPVEGLYTLFMIEDLGPYLSWLGITVAAAAVAWLALVERALPRWLGVVSALTVALPLAALVGTGLTGVPGIVGPAWLVVASVGLLARRTPARA